MARLAAAKEKRREAPDTFQFHTVTAKDGAVIRFGAQSAGSEKRDNGTVIFVPGRTEFIEKFFEDMHVWNGFGFTAAGIDLRGQGLSTRPGPTRDKHYVTSFDDHLDDLDTVLSALEEQGAPKPFYLMAHSAGSHVSLRYLHRYPTRIEKAVLVAPMIGIANGGLPGFVVKSLPALMSAIGLGAAYVPGHGKFKVGEWGWRKQLTHDMDRFEDEDFFINTQNADLAVGGATHRWVHEAHKSCAALTANGVPEAIKTPFIILQAGEEAIVDNAAQDAFVARAPAGKLVCIKGAKHEILKETDDKRLIVWRSVADFIGLDAGLL